jgi:hypothetical protein
MTKQNAIELVNVSPASIFTREDVVKIINSIDDVPAVDEIADVVEETPDDEDNRLIAFKRGAFLNVLVGVMHDEFNRIDLRREAEVELSMGYDRQIEIDSIDYSFDDVIDQVRADVEDWIDNNANPAKA